jgi:general secretion pathway protein A
VSVGPIGTGKTTLLYCLQHILRHESAPGSEVRSAFIVNPVLQQNELYETLLDELEISCATATKPAQLRAFHGLLLDTHRMGGGVVIIIDEAHLLPPELLEEIRLLLNLDNYAVNVLQVILCGQPELMQVLRRPECAALRARVAVITKLRPLTLVESRAYVAERLHIAGLRGENPFTTSALEHIYRHSNGVPRTINLICDRAMTCASQRETYRIDPEIVAEAVEDLMLLDATPEISPAAAHQLVDVVAPKRTP